MEKMAIKMNRDLRRGQLGVYNGKLFGARITRLKDDKANKYNGQLTWPGI